MYRIVSAGMMVLSLSVMALAADDNKDVKRYADNGVAFNYPKDAKVKDKVEKDSTSIEIDLGDVVSCRVSVESGPLDAKALLDLTVKAYKDGFKDKVVKGSEKASKRKILGAEREGQQMDVKLTDDVSLRSEVFGITTPAKKTLMVTLMYPTNTPAASLKKLSAILDSLEEAKK